jgi:hypothetical protein
MGFWLVLCDTTVEVVMFTTAGLTCSARSAKLSGRAFATSACAITSAVVSIVSQSARSRVCFCASCGIAMDLAFADT